MQLGPESVKYLVFVVLGIWVIIYAFRSVELKGKKGLAAALVLLGVTVVAGGVVSHLLFARHLQGTLTREAVQILTKLHSFIGGFAAGIITAVLLAGNLFRKTQAKQLSGQGEAQKAKDTRQGK